MRVIVVASGEKDWLRRVALREVSVPTLVWVEGPHAIAESHRMSAVLSECGLPNRWVPLYRRPTLRQEALSRPWPQTRLHAFLQEVPLLVLSDTDTHLKALWNTFKNQNLLQETLYLVRHYRHPLFQDGPISLSSETSSRWVTLYEDLAPDLHAAAAWLPCKLISTLT